VQRIIIDTDPGIDDAMAIYYALASSHLDVVGLTTVFGNCEVDVCTTNALRLLEIAGRSDIAVAEGARRPLAQEFRGAAAFVHGEDGLGEVDLPAPTTAADPRNAAQFIIDTVMAAPGEITLVPIGPMTNVALAMLLEPRLDENLAGIVMMGGNAFCLGNTTPAAEANIVNDPEAADIVFGARCPVTMVGLDVTEQVLMTSADIDMMATIDTERARLLARVVPHYLAFHRSRGIDGIHVHDSTAISYLLAPDAFGSTAQPVRVDCGDGVGRGKTWPSVRHHDRSDRPGPWDGRRPTTILTEVDARRVIEMELEHLRVA
jgi:purine nucleosidase